MNTPAVQLLSRILLLLILTGATVACGGDNRLDGPARAGTLTVAVEIDNSAVTTDGVTVGTSLPMPDAGISLTLTDLTGGYSHSWADTSQFPQGDYFLSGVYTLSSAWGSASLEGFDRPSYSGTQSVTIEEGSSTDAVVSLTLDNALVRAQFDSSIERDFSEFALLVHTPGGQFFEITPGESRILCLKPDHTGIFAELTMPDGREARLLLLTRETTDPATLYEVIVTSETTSEGVRLSASWGDETNSILITDRLLDDPAPAVTLSWDPAATISLPEGETCAQPLRARVSASVPLGSVILATSSLSL
ncbi:MAG: DUF4493 domain-containing protein, partial [Duncaniella sp.]|nr:DUF4493 domain-containing protein [Duncaniella sp.]